ncbi:MAG: hypothetical protein AABY40_01800 [Nanoarchaeota archaeon]
MIGITLITLVTAVALVSMYWQPSFGSGSYSGPPRRPSEKEEYIGRIEGLIRMGDYATVQSLLEKPKFPLTELPIAYWKGRLAAERNETVERIKKLDALQSLEEILG